MIAWFAKNHVAANLLLVTLVYRLKYRLKYSLHSKPT